ncbi:MAG TPA: TfoX/Sxy family protein [Alphaproteobacteria bacterium]
MAKWEGTHDVGALAENLRRRLGALTNIPAAAITEKRMFGGVCFLLRGNMLCGAGKNGYMIRTDRARQAEAERLPGGLPVVMRGRAMQGFFWVDPEACDGKELDRWLALGEAYVAKLPAKSLKRPKRSR